MAIAFSATTNGSSTSNSASYAFTAFTPAVDDLIVVHVIAGATAATPGLTDDQDGGTYYLATSQSIGGDLHCIFVREALVASAVSHALTFTCTGDNADGCAYAQIRFTGSLRAGADVVRQTGKDSGAAGGTPAATAAAACLTSNAVSASVGNSTNPAGLTPPGSFTERYDGGYNTPTTGLEAATRDSGHTSATVTWGSTSASTWGALFVELDASAPSAINDSEIETFPGYGARAPRTAARTVSAAALALTSMLGQAEAADYVPEPPMYSEREEANLRRTTPRKPNLAAILACVALGADDEVPVLEFAEDEPPPPMPTQPRVPLRSAQPILDNDPPFMCAAGGPQDYTARFDPNDPGGVATTGGDVTDLYDLSVNGNDLAQATAGSRPQLVDDGGTDVVEVVALSGDYLTSDGIVGIGAYLDTVSPYAFSFVARVKLEGTIYADETANINQLAALMSDGNIGSFDDVMAVGFRDHSTNGIEICFGWSGTDFSQQIVAASAEGGTWGVVSAKWDGSTLYVRWNKGTWATLTPGVSLLAPGGDFNIGKAGGNQFQGKFQDIYTFSRPISTSESDALVDEINGVSACIHFEDEYEHRAQVTRARTVSPVALAAHDDGGDALTAPPSEIVEEDGAPVAAFAPRVPARAAVLALAEHHTDEVAILEIAEEPAPPTPHAPRTIARAAQPETHDDAAGFLYGAPTEEYPHALSLPPLARTRSINRAAMPVLEHEQNIPAGALYGVPTEEYPAPLAVTLERAPLWAAQPVTSDEQVEPAGALYGVPTEEHVAPLERTRARSITLPPPPFNDEIVPQPAPSIEVTEDEAGPMPRTRARIIAPLYLPDPDVTPELFAAALEDDAAPLVRARARVIARAALVQHKDDEAPEQPSVREDEAPPSPLFRARAIRAVVPVSDDEPVSLGVSEDYAHEQRMARARRIVASVTIGEDEIAAAPPEEYGPPLGRTHAAARRAVLFADDDAPRFFLEAFPPDELDPRFLFRPRVPFIYTPAQDGDVGWESIYSVEMLRRLPARTWIVTLDARGFVVRVADRVLDVEAEQRDDD